MTPSFVEYPIPQMDPSQVNLALAVQHIQDALMLLGHDTQGRASTRATPLRIAKWWRESARHAPLGTMTSFPLENPSGLVIVRDIDFSSLCSHHFLPFYGVAHVGYIPTNRILGLSKIARIVDWCAKSPQTQEELTSEIAGVLRKEVECQFVGVVMKATHSCMSCRGVRKTGAITTTSCFVPSAQEGTKQEFLKMLEI